MFPAESAYHLNATVKEFEGTQAVLEIDGGQTVQWPIKDLPDDVAVGKKIRLMISTEESNKQAQEKLVHAVLNSLLHD